MTIKPGRLRRTLAINSTENLFELYLSDSGLYNADTVGDVSISHGKSNPGGGMTVATMSCRVHSTIPAGPQRHAKFRLSSALANRIVEGTGVPPEAIRYRFTGRIGADTITDRSDRHARYTDIQCSSWTALLKNGKRSTVFYANGLVLASLRNAFAHPSFTAAGIAPVNFPDTAHSDRTYELEGNEFRFDEAIRKYAEDIGILIQQRRDGSISLLPITKRIEIMNSRISSQWPLLRSQAISPATWDQQVETASKQYTLLWLTDQNTVYRWEWPLPSGANPGVIVESEDVDWSNIRTITNNYRRYMDAINYETNAMRHTLSSVTIDMIMLLKSPRYYDRVIAAQILALEEGDPFYLAGDWPPAINGPQLVQGIDEKITGDEWTLELSLTNPRNTLGLNPDEIPTVPPKVWDSARSAWNTTAGTWDSF